MSLYHKPVLKTRERVIFNPANDSHLRDFASFLKNNNWKNGCNYYLEEPYQDIPTMIKAKVVDFFLSPYVV